MYRLATCLSTRQSLILRSLLYSLLCHIPHTLSHSCHTVLLLSRSRNLNIYSLSTSRDTPFIAQNSASSIFVRAKLVSLPGRHSLSSSYKRSLNFSRIVSILLFFSLLTLLNLTVGCIPSPP